MVSIACSNETLTLVLSKASAEKEHILAFRGHFGENGQFLATSVGGTKMSSWYVMTTSATENAEKRGLSCWAYACIYAEFYASGCPKNRKMALTLQALGLEAKDQGVSESAWIVQIAGTIIFQKIIHSWKTPIMRSVYTLQSRFRTHVLRTFY